MSDRDGGGREHLVYGSLFSGYEGLTLGVQSVWPGRTAWHCEIDPGATKILAHHWPTVPNLGDITSVDWDAVEPVDVLTGGFPCQDVSTAGLRRGLRPGTRSGLWSHMARAIDALRPALVVIENVRGLLSAEAHSDLERDCWCVGDERDPALRALGAVLGDLADLGYDARWCGVRAADVGAPHRRERIFVVAHPRRLGAQVPYPGEQPAVTEPGGDGAPGGSGLALLPTPAANDMGEGKLPGTARLLPTPKGSDGPNGGPGMRNGRGQVDALPAIAALLPTPLENALARFGDYAPAVARWEHVLGRPAPDPTTSGRLNPAFVEFMMGLPAGHVTGVPGLSSAAQLKALGNGVVPQQAAHALRVLGIAAAMADQWGRGGAA